MYIKRAAFIRKFRKLMEDIWELRLLCAGADVPGGGLGAQRVLVVLDAAAVLVAPLALQGRGGRRHATVRALSIQ